jgi:glycosyltransferase involved in cell wall biosynthesis
VIEGLVSTIIPVFNRASMLREAVDSVLTQTWPQIEIVIVDDGSTDDTAQVADELASLRPDVVRVLHQANAGPGMARQAGFERSQGEFIQFLDSDDVLLANKFEWQVAGLRNDPEAGVAYGKTYTRENGVLLPTPAQHTGERHRRLFPALLSEPLWPTLTPLYRRTVLNAAGAWPKKKQLEDWEFDAQVAELGTQLHFVDAYIAETRNHADDRLCHLWMTDANAMRDRLAAYPEVLRHAQRAGVKRDTPEMQQFVRSLFWMARNAGRFGLPQQARQLFELARSQAIDPGWDYRLFAVGSRLLGWKRASQLAEAAGRWRT